MLKVQKAYQLAESVFVFKAFYFYTNTSLWRQEPN